MLVLSTYLSLAKCILYSYIVVRGGNQAMLRVPPDYAQRDVDETSSVAELLPSLRMPGLCATVLLHKMEHIQNTLLEEYHSSVLKKE